MTARTDLAALARAIHSELEKRADWCAKETVRKSLVKSERLINEGRKTAYQWAADQLGYALRDAVLSEPAVEADGFAWVKTRAEIGRLTAEVESLRAQLESAAPLFEACREYAIADALFIVHGGWRSASARVDAMRRLAKEAVELAKK